MLMMGALTVLMLSQIVDVAEAVQGFGNTGMLTVATLFVVATGIQNTGAVDPIRRLLERHAITSTCVLLFFFFFFFFDQKGNGKRKDTLHRGQNSK